MDLSDIISSAIAVAALVVAVIGIRQARASGKQSAEAIRIARLADARDADRRHEEQTPKMEVTADWRSLNSANIGHIVILSNADGVTGINAQILTGTAYHWTRGTNGVQDPGEGIMPTIAIFDGPLHRGREHRWQIEARSRRSDEKVRLLMVWARGEEIWREHIVLDGPPLARITSASFG